ncbi:hypothetical protein DL96DRAFT_1671091 [Flagelloscypha sp. PMI_526]|nr:hypothetical protein DL96DRAFT_1671091 [Flagelloscypha sp. PMI_526]
MMFSPALSSLILFVVSAFCDYYHLGCLHSVIAGGGLTGLVVANKLSAKGKSVLVIEAGKNLPDNPAIYDVERHGELGNDPATDCNWHYTGTNEDGSDISIKIDSGKCVGGSTSINGVMWFRPARVELDTLQALGNDGWNAAKLNSSVHGFHGLINTSFPTPMRIPSAQALYKAAISAEYNLPVSVDLSKRQGSALASASWSLWYDGTTNRRSSAAYAFLYPASQARSTLTVLFDHTVDKVLFDSKIKANGIQFGPTGGGALLTVNATKEVILASGSLASPAILERSGVGAKSVVTSFGIASLVDLPGVGTNLQDQPGTGLAALLTTSAAANTSIVDGRSIFAPVVGLGDLTNAARAEALVAAGSSSSVAAAKLILGTAIDLMVNKGTAVGELIGESYPGILEHIFWPSTPLSRGHIHIQTADPFTQAKIVPRFWSDEFDQDLGITLAKKTPQFSSIVTAPAIDGPPVGASDADWLAWLKETAFGASHWTGSCAMLPKNKGGVVSNKLKVYGTTGLRVVDLSILPLQITSHTQSMGYAISQKAADLILAEA